MTIAKYLVLLLSIFLVGFGPITMICTMVSADGDFSLGAFSPDGGGAGSEESILVPDSATLSAGSNADLSVFCWAKGATADNNNTPVISKYNSGSNGRLFYMGAGVSPDNDHLYVITCNNSTTCNGAASGRRTVIADGASDIAFDDTWHHIGFTVEDNGASTTLKLYLDGSEVSYTTLEAGSSDELVNDDTADLYIGDVEAFSAFSWNGHIDDCFVKMGSGTVLSASDVSNMYNGGKPKDESGKSPDGYWTFESTDHHSNAGGIVDQSSNSNDGTGQNLESDDINDSDVP